MFGFPLMLGQRPLAPPVEAKLRIADQRLGAAKERDATVNARGHLDVAETLLLGKRGHEPWRTILAAEITDCRHPADVVDGSAHHRCRSSRLC